MWVCTKAVRFASSHNFKQPMEGRWNWRVGVQQDTYIARSWNFGHFPKLQVASAKKNTEMCTDSSKLSLNFNAKNTMSNVGFTHVLFSADGRLAIK